MGTLHGRVSRGAKTEQGAIAIIVAISMVGLLVVAGMVLDFGLARLDRQTNKSAADAAVAAGIRGFDQGDGQVYAFNGVCDAITFLKVKPEFSSLAKPAYCTAGSAELGRVCKEAVPNSLPPTYSSVLTNGYTVTIAAHYTLPDPNFPEDNLASMSGDNASPCDNLAVIITQARKPGLGSLAGASQLKTTIRSVGRVIVGKDGQGAVALLLLERTECGVLSNSSNNTRIRVLGYGPVPGIIHADSLGSTSCTAKPVFYSQPDYGIIAYESEDVPKKPGIISARSMTGEPGAVATNTQQTPNPGDPPKIVAMPEPGLATGHGLISRSVVDDRYLTGITQTRDNANALLNSTTAPTGYTAVLGGGRRPDPCSPTVAELALAGKLWINCSSFTGPAVFRNATDLIFKGQVSGSLEMPMATRVYIEGSASPYGVNANIFRMHYDSSINPASSSPCSSGNHPSRAQLVIREGKFTTGGSSPLVQMCHTSVVMLGGSTATTASGCLPTTSQQAYTTNSCNGILDITGGALHWTAPDAVGEAERTSTDFANLEDLAFWTEASGGGSKVSAELNLAGVFMLPNAKPFNINGTGTFRVENAQFVADTLDLGGSGILNLRPDPRDSITIPIIGGFGLVR